MYYHNHMFSAKWAPGFLHLHEFRPVISKRILPRQRPIYIMSYKITTALCFRTLWILQNLLFTSQLPFLHFGTKNVYSNLNVIAPSTPSFNSSTSPYKGPNPRFKKLLVQIPNRKVQELLKWPNLSISASFRTQWPCGYGLCTETQHERPPRASSHSGERF